MGLLWLELLVIALFILCIYNARRSAKKLGLLILTSVYAIIFENFNILLSAGKVGGYFYSSQLMLFVGQVPLFVILAWSIIIYSAYNFTNAIGIFEKRKAFGDAFFITLIDLIIDPVATRLGLWTWQGYSNIEGFFGVPGNNFLGWLLISFIFLSLFRYVDRSKFSIRKTLFVFTPLISYCVFLVLFTIINQTELILNFSKRAELILFFVVFLVFFFLMTRKDEKIKKDRKSVLFYYFIRGMFYLFAIVGVIYLELYKNEFIVLIGILAMLLVELGIYFRYIFKNGILTSN